MTTETKQVLTADLRQNLKDLFAKELEQLPEYLEALDTKERLDTY